MRGTMGEFVLAAAPDRVGLFTRLAALGMVGFVVLGKSLTDLYGHQTMGARLASGLDRLPRDHSGPARRFWVLLLVVLVVKAAGRGR